MRQKGHVGMSVLLTSLCSLTRQIKWDFTYYNRYINDNFINVAIENPMLDACLSTMKAFFIQNETVLLVQSLFLQ